MSLVISPTLCECGCGQPVKHRFVHGHNSKTLGRQKSSEHRAKIAASLKGRPCPRPFPAGEDNPEWKGEDAGYQAKHCWMRRHYPLTGTCETCNRSDRPTEWANLDHEYRRVREDWRELCRSCHAIHDRAHGLRFTTRAAQAA